MAKKCSIIIPTKDKLTRLYLTLKCLESQVDMDTEVIVVFDGCNKETLEAYKTYQWSFDVIPVISVKNVGRAAARNLGLKQATGKVVIFLDDDRLTEKDFVKKHLSYHQGETCVVLGERMDLKNTEEDIMRLIEQDSIEKVLDIVKKKSVKEFYYNIKKFFLRDPYDKLRYIAFITGNVSIDTAILREISGFDEGFKGWGYEDTDLGYRLAVKGIKYIEDNDITCYHLLHAHAKRQKSKEELANLKYFKQKFPEDKVLQRTLAFYTLKASLKL